MGDITDKRLLYFKGALFALLGLLAVGLILIEYANLRLALLLAIAIWSFCRAYYFAFYVIQHYIDPDYQFAGLGSFVRYLWQRRRSGNNMQESIPAFLFLTGTLISVASSPCQSLLAEDKAVKPTSRPLVLHQRTVASKPTDDPAAKPTTKETTVEWDPGKTALIICDMWDNHWCKGGARRVEELAGPMNKVVTEARKRGVFIIHAPSTTVDFYKETPQRKRALQAKTVKTPFPLATVERWGTAWCYPDPKRESELPIDDTDMGCDCETKCEIVPPWTRQIATIEIAEPDAITDNGQETFNLLAERGIDNVMIMGVHLNMCVLGRPFAIRQLVAQGKNVLLIRDMTDTMYCSKCKPFVDHFSGTDLVVTHVEKNWCPTIQSTDIVGGKPFRFREDKRSTAASRISNAP